MLRRTGFHAHRAAARGSRSVGVPCRALCTLPPSVGTTTTARAVDYPQWYADVIAAGDLVDSTPTVKGCAILKPDGYALWEAVRNWLDAEIKASGHRNVYFPALVPTSLLSREATHVAGFAKECAVVTHHRLSADDATGGLRPDPEAELTDPLVLRPTSEAVVWHALRRWIHSHRDLPMLLNQWANVFRWELRTRPFLRTSEFLWQEGHTAHATAGDASLEARNMLQVYQRLCHDVLAVPVVPGDKSVRERFAGAEATHTVEAMMQNGWALQAGTSHFLGQNFAKAFDVTYQTEDGDREHVWATSWGVSTRLIGAVIMTHSDDTGLVLPPAVAPFQAVVVAISDKPQVTAAVRAVSDQLHAAGVRHAVDTNVGWRPGRRYFEWERRGTPLRIEIGPKDVAHGAVTVKARPSGSKRQAVPLAAVGVEVPALLAAVQQSLFDAAQSRMAARTVSVFAYADMKAALHADGDDSVHRLDGPAFFLAPWCEDGDAEAAVQADCKATLRCYPHEHNTTPPDAPCFYSGKPATHMALFARAF